ncbi:MAG: hypothetical protein GOMPHAMPRED_000685 [Gomphillus americanus]|uniref:Uncharacterized protein n=1 Tax=Gomphillus americanus TaxID=1940652 RepID=A0A8H3EZD8_9LECA|nr:MAG: hypothetical protein GOMPHAMPRED_000685 [Gomphillus americanus]
MKCSTGLLSVSTALLVSAFFVSGNLLRQEAQGLVVRRLGITDGSSDVLLKAFLLESGLSNTLEGYPNKCLSEYYRSNSQPLLTAEDIEASLTDQWWGLDPDVEQDEVLTTRFIPSDELPRVHAQDIDLRTRELTGVNDTAYSSSLSHLKDQVYGHTYQKRSVLLPRIPTTSIQGSSSPISSQAENEPRQYSGQQSSMGSVSAPVSRAGSPNRPRLATGAQQQQSTPGSPNMDRVQSLPSEGHSFNNPRPRFPVRRPNTLQFLVDLAHNYRPGGMYLHMRILNFADQSPTMSLSGSD